MAVKLADPVPVRLSQCCYERRMNGSMLEKSAEHYSWWQQQPIDVRDWPVLIDDKSQLFIDDHMIAARTNVEKQFHQPVKYENPVLLPEHPWEGVTCLAHGTVIKEASGRLRMYYTGFLLESP